MFDIKEPGLAQHRYRCDRTARRTRTPAAVSSGTNAALSLAARRRMGICSTSPTAMAVSSASALLLLLSAPLTAADGGERDGGGAAAGTFTTGIFENLSWFQNCSELTPK